MASIDYPRGKPRVRWRDPDGTPHASTCETEKAAKDLLRQVQYAEDTGRIWRPEIVRQTTPLREIAAAWLQVLSRVRAEGTLYHRAGQIEAFLQWYESRHGKNADASFLSMKILEEYWESLKNGRWGRTNLVVTQNRHLGAIHMLWEWAEGRDEYEGQIPRPRRMVLAPTQPGSPRPVPTWNEMDACILQAEGWRRCVLVVMRCTGVRVQQAMMLRWEDVEDQILYLPGKLGKTKQERNGREIPLASTLLREWKEKRLCEWTDSEWIVPCPHPHRLVRSRDIARIWEKTEARPAVWKKRPDHCFRAGFQTGLRAFGFSRELTEYLVGHAMPGVDIHYIDPFQAMPLMDAVKLIPALPGQISETGGK